MTLTEMLKKTEKNPKEPLDPPEQPSQEEKSESYDKALQKWRGQVDEEKRKSDRAKSTLINWNLNKKTTKK